MPEGNVVISGTFSQIPVESVYLKILSVSVNSTITPELGYDADNYTAKIPHIYPTDTNQKFSIIAIPEDPNADVLISPASQDDNGEILLNEGKTEYTITVASGKLDPKTYTFTVDYEPDLSLKSIELSTGENSEWTHTIPVQDGQTIIIPYDSVTIAAIPNDEGVTLNASKTGVDGTFSSDGQGKWTLAYPYQSANTLNSTVKIKSTKSINDGNYEKDFTLQFEKIVDADWPTSFWAESTGEGNGKSIIKDDGNYYEVHTFITSGTLSFPADDGATGTYLSSDAFDYLIVAGGGGAGGDNGNGQFTQFDYAGGGGAGGLLYKTGVPLSLQNGSVAVVVGAGGAGGPAGDQGANGGLSAIGSIEVPGGGGGGGAGNSNMNGVGGGSGGGGASSSNGVYNTAGSPSSTNTDIQGHSGGLASTNNSWHDGGGGGGGAGSAGGAGGGSGNMGVGGNPWNAANMGASWIHAAVGINEFSRGGNGGGTNAPDGGSSGVNYGDGGSGSKSTGTGTSGGNGHDGIVIVRFPAKPNLPADDDE